MNLQLYEDNTEQDETGQNSAIVNTGILTKPMKIGTKKRPQLNFATTNTQ